MMSRINSTEKYAVLWLDSQGFTAEQIVNELGLTPKQVKNVLSKTNKNNNIKTKSESMGVSSSKNLMIRETANRKNHVAVMTQEASMVNDEAKKKNPSKKLQNNIFKINND